LSYKDSYFEKIVKGKLISFGCFYLFKDDNDFEQEVIIGAVLARIEVNRA